MWILPYRGVEKTKNLLTTTVEIVGAATATPLPS